MWYRPFCHVRHAMAFAKRYGFHPAYAVYEPGFTRAGAALAKAAKPKGGKAVAGGKPRWLPARMIEDYSRPGQLVCDPCSGGFTTLEAAQETGRRFVGGDMLREHAEIGARLLRGMHQAPLFTESGAA